MTEALGTLRRFRPPHSPTNMVTLLLCWRELPGIGDYMAFGVESRGFLTRTKSLDGSLESLTSLWFQQFTEKLQIKLKCFYVN